MKRKFKVTLTGSNKNTLDSGGKDNGTDSHIRGSRRRL